MVARVASGSDSRQTPLTAVVEAGPKEAKRATSDPLTSVPGSISIEENQNGGHSLGPLWPTASGGGGGRVAAAAVASAAAAAATPPAAAAAAPVDYGEIAVNKTNLVPAGGDPGGADRT